MRFCVFQCIICMCAALKMQPPGPFFSPCALTKSPIAATLSWIKLIFSAGRAAADCSKDQRPAALFIVSLITHTQQHFAHTLCTCDYMCQPCLIFLSGHAAGRCVFFICPVSGIYYHTNTQLMHAYANACAW